MEIRAGNPYPAGALSNFARRLFVVRGVTCHSMEGFLQSLKFKDPERQKSICLLFGLKAKRAGQNKNWQMTQTLWWQGEPIKRDSKEYQELLDEAYDALFSQDEGARKALGASGNATLKHSMGRSKINETVLTRREFCGRLTRKRTELKSDNLLGF